VARHYGTRIGCVLGRADRPQVPHDLPQRRVCGGPAHL